LSKAQRGLWLVADALKRRFHCEIEFGTIYICTNKQAKNGFLELFHRQMKSEEQRFKIVE